VVSCQWSVDAPVAVVGIDTPFSKKGVFPTEELVAHLNDFAIVRPQLRGLSP
jgi:hypothetical protein